MRLARGWTLLLFLYIGADFVDPSIPGIFFFDNHSLFVDGVVQFKGQQVSASVPKGSTSPLGRSIDVTVAPRVPLKLMLPELTSPGYLRRVHFRQDFPTSAAPPSPPEDH